MIHCIRTLSKMQHAVKQNNVGWAWQTNGVRDPTLIFVATPHTGLPLKCTLIHESLFSFYNHINLFLLFKLLLLIQVGSKNMILKIEKFLNKNIYKSFKEIGTASVEIVESNGLLAYTLHKQGRKYKLTPWMFISPRVNTVTHI